MIEVIDGEQLFYERSQKENGVPVLFIHSALGTHEELGPIRELFTDRAQIAVDLPSHGNSASTTYTSTDRIARGLLQLLDRLKIESVDVVGYSLGGYIGLEMAVQSPLRIRSVVSHAMKFYWTGDAIDRATAGLDPSIVRDSPRFFDALTKAHTGGAESVLLTMRAIIHAFAKRKLSASDVLGAGTPVLVTAGDSDELIPLSELLALYDGLGRDHACLSVFPATRHSIRTLPLPLFEHSVRTFWNTLPKP